MDGYRRNRTRNRTRPRHRLLALLAVATLAATGCTPLVLGNVDAARSAAHAPALGRSDALASSAAARARAMCSTGSVVPAVAGTYADAPAATHEMVAAVPLDPGITDPVQRNVAATGAIWAQWRADPGITAGGFTEQGAGEATCADGKLYMSEVLRGPAPTLPAGLYSTQQYDPSTVVATTGLTYASAVDYSGATVALLADVYTPPAGAPTPRPTVILVHGGAFVGGSRSDYAGVARKWAARGYVAVAIDYRLDPRLVDDASPPKQLAAATNAILDAEQASMWIKANAASYGVDAAKVFAVGDSAGGAIVLGMSAAPDAQRTGPNAAFSSSIVAAVSTGAYLTPGIDAGVLHPGAGLAPILMFHYETDVASNTGAYAFRTCAAYRAAGSTCEYVSQAGEGHTTDLTPGGPWWTGSIGPFLFRLLGLGG